MKIKAILIFTLITTVSTVYAQKTVSFDKWNWLIGTWIGEGNGQPGHGGGSFSFSAMLDNNILVSKSHSEYPAKDNKPEIIHEDLMVIYGELKGNPSKAIYFDNEGHTINYQITYGDNTIVLTSDKMPDTPIFRLSYSFIDTETVNTKFEISNDGEKFFTYIEGKSKKKK